MATVAKVQVRIDRKAFNHVFSSTEGPIGQHIRKLTVDVHREARRAAPVNEGRLRNDIQWKLSPSTRGLTGTVFNTVKYARWVHDGTKAHVIRARTKKVLKFPGSKTVMSADEYTSFRKAGGFVFRKSVNHPGTKSNQYLKNALRIIQRRT